MLKALFICSNALHMLVVGFHSLFEFLFWIYQIFQHFFWNKDFFETHTTFGCFSYFHYTKIISIIHHCSKYVSESDFINVTSHNFGTYFMERFIDFRNHCMFSYYMDSTRIYLHLKDFCSSHLPCYIPVQAPT